MISRLLEVMERGLTVMRSNSRMLLVGVLVFVFPLLFMWITQGFFETAANNIATAEKNRIGILHDSFSAVLESGITSEAAFQHMIASVMADNQDISKLSIYRQDEHGLLTVYGNDPEQNGQYDTEAATILQKPFSDTYNFQMSEYIIDGARIAEVVKRIKIENSYYYLYTEHDFSTIDRTMSYRRQQSYFGLTAIFLFLIVLAYWLNRQVNWQHNHELLAEQLKERDLFSNMIAHEFRAPLTAIKGYASFISEAQAVPPDEKRYAANISSAAERLVTLVNDFLEVARLQSGKMAIKRQPVDLSLLLTSVVTDLMVTASNKNLTLALEPPKQDATISTDPDRLTQVMTNIINNAIKYTDMGGVQIAYTTDRDNVVIRVKDTGTGIAADDQKKLFAPFTRVGGADTGTVTGSGLGMWITRQLIQLLGGTIGVESIKGVGTHVVITLPLGE